MYISIYLPKHLSVCLSVPFRDPEDSMKNSNKANTKARNVFIVLPKSLWSYDECPVKKKVVQIYKLKST